MGQKQNWVAGGLNKVFFYKKNLREQNTTKKMDGIGFKEKAA